MKQYLKYVSALLATVLSVFSSCDDFLTTESPSKLSNEVVYQTGTMAEAAMMGVYGRLTASSSYGQKVSVNWQGLTDIEGASGTFNETNYNSTTRDDGPSNFYDAPSNNNTKWQAFYELSEAAANVIDGIRNSPILESQSYEMRPLLGEALTLHALANSDMVRYWGDIPYKSEASRSDLSNVYMGKIDKDSIYADLVRNLVEATEYVPWLGTHPNYSTAERISKGYVYGLLAKVALQAAGWSLRDGNTFPNLDVEHHPSIPEANGYFVGRTKNHQYYYQIAAWACAQMLGSPDNPHQLDPEFENIWRTVCGQEQNTSHENLFEIAFGMGQNGDIGSLMGYSVAGGSKYGNRGFGGSYANSTMYYFYSFDKEDTRRDATLTFRRWRADDYEDLSFNPVSVAFNKWRIYWCTDAFLAMQKTATSRIATGINWVMMRYSDVLLMYAEAMNELEGPDAAHADAKGLTARKALEQVRARAFGTGSSKITDYDSDFFTAIVNERAWEFGGESIRKTDLVRWGLAYEKIEAMKEALCLMMDNKEAVTIFDKTYQASDFPQVVYYTYKDGDYQDDGTFRGEYVDPASINYYTNLATAPSDKYTALNWFPLSMMKEIREDGTVHNENYKIYPLRTLLAGTGLYPNYDYSGLLSRMTNGAEIQEAFNTYTTGNKECYYRTYYAIHTEDIYESKGYLTNAYGY